MAFLVAGTQSGCGKTTVTLALMQHLRAAGMRVAPFKAGPDFLDPMWHQTICKRDSYNLDTRMMGEDECRRVFAARAHDADVTIIEGVMGLFDGATGVGAAGSSAHLAEVLDVPVLLVVNVKGMSGSIVPLVEGFVRRANAMGAHIMGIIANRVGSERHAGLLRELLADYDLPPLIAWMQKNAPELSERHLGLKIPDEARLPDFSCGFHMEANIFTTKAQRRKEEKEETINSEPLRLCDKTIAVARDEAFCFIYPANIEWMKESGAEILFFSPIVGESVPEKADALWLPGGYPELYAETLSASSSWQSLRAFIETGKPVLAECGGMMVLGKTLIDCQGRSWPMPAFLPCSFKMENRLVSLGYRKESEGARGHEFHHSRRVGGHHARPAFTLKRGDPGMRYRNVRASYVHWYFPSQPEAAARWFV